MERGGMTPLSIHAPRVPDSCEWALRLTRGWREANAASCPQHYPQLSQRSDSIPKGLRHEAQGCEERATLGEPAMASQPQRGCDRVGTETDAAGVGSWIVLPRLLFRFGNRRNPRWGC